MLVFSLAKNEAIVVADEIVVRVLEVWGDTVEILIERPEGGSDEYQTLEPMGCEADPIP